MADPGYRIPDPPASDAGIRIGRYRVLELLGEGTFGTVYLAEETSGLRRLVALKVLRRKHGERQRARFEVERQALARMDHDGIARILDAGLLEDDRPFLAMEFVDGLSITEHCARRGLDLKSRLLLFRDVCLAVQHAHQQGVIHRDLKPSNVLVVEHADGSRPKVIDFGLARGEDRILTPDAAPTLDGEVLGTLAYMSPEQWRGSRAAVDTRTDVYALGVLLHELLTECLPHAGADGTLPEVAELGRRVREGLVLPPEPPREFRNLRRALRGDLDGIVRKALEPDRSHRYAAASDLAADLERHLRHEPVSAGPRGFGYHLARFVRRHWLESLAGAAALLTLVIALVVSLVLLRQVDEARRRAAERTEAANESLGRYHLLEHVIRARRAREAEAGLHPARPERAADMERWLAEQAEPLCAALPKLEAELARLQAAPPRTGSAEQFLCETLADLVAELKTFDKPSVGLVAKVRARLAWARQVAELTVVAHAEAWEQARAAVAADARFPGFALRPQVGLVPLGLDPDSRLQEFVDLRSCSDPLHPPERDAVTGHLRASEDMGVVLVLVPGGDFAMGAQAEDPDGENFFAEARPNEGPVHHVVLAPFLLSKFELTQAQWRRMTGERAGFFPAGMLLSDGVRISGLHPAENVSWEMAGEMLRRNGLALPTEARWEYACRAGTETPWSCGPDKLELRRYANVADAVVLRCGRSMAVETEWEDGFAAHAPVGSFLPNAFGLHDMHGNVTEWCEDWFADYRRGVRDGDGLRIGGAAALRAVRGGSFQSVAKDVRSGERDGWDPRARLPYQGECGRPESWIAEAQAVGATRAGSRRARQELAAGPSPIDDDPRAGA